MSIPEIVYVDVENTEVICTLDDCNVVLTADSTTDVISGESLYEFSTLGVQGPPGPAGPAGVSGTQSVDIPAGMDVGDFRVVVASGGKIYHADKDVLTDRDKILGVTDAGYNTDDTATVYIGGAIVNPLWAFNDGLVYLGDDGALTQTLPVAGFLLQIGIAITATALLMDVDRVIEDHEGYHDDEYINVDEEVDGGAF